MSTQSTEATETATEDTTASTENAETEAKPTETVDFWKAKAREQEKRAKENAAAAKRLAEIEDAQKAEAQKAADALTKAEQRALEAEKRALSLEIATQHKLGPEDAALLAALPDEDSMQALARRLAGQAEEQRKAGPRVPKQGTQTAAAATGDDVMRDAVRNLFNT